MSAFEKNLKIIFVFTSKNLFESQKSNFDSLKNFAKTKGAGVYYKDSQELKQISSDYQQKDTEGDLAIFTQENGQLALLEVLNDLSDSEDWGQALKTYLENRENQSPDEEDMYRWGQVVPEAGEYLCVDCGFVLELEQGQAFPICEVCLSGLPEGPSSPDKGFWEKV